MSDKTTILETLRDAINLALCEEDGHEWVEVRTETIQSPGDALGSTTSLPVEKCERCGTTHTRLDIDSSGDAVPAEWDFSTDYTIPAEADQ